MKMLDSLIEIIKSDVAAEVAECEAIDAERIQKQIKERPGRYESLKGFYVIGDTGRPMYLTKNTWCVKTLFHNWGKMTVFKHKKRAKQVVRDTKIKIILGGLICSIKGIYPTEGENNVYHFLDTDSRKWLPTSQSIEICDELPKSLVGRILSYLPPYDMG